MPRKLPPWIGRTADTPVPDRVKARIRAKQEGKCAITGLELKPGHIHYDHILALADGGANSEANLQAVGVEPHKEKSALEAAVRAKVNAIAKKHFDGKKAKRPIQSAGFAKAPKPPAKPPLAWKPMFVKLIKEA